MKTRIYATPAVKGLRVNLHYYSVSTEVLTTEQDHWSEVSILFLMIIIWLPTGKSLGTDGNMGLIDMLSPFQ